MASDLSRTLPYFSRMAANSTDVPSRPLIHTITSSGGVPLTVFTKATPTQGEILSVMLLPYYQATVYSQTWLTGARGCDEQRPC